MRYRNTLLAWLVASLLVAGVLVLGAPTASAGGAESDKIASGRWDLSTAATVVTATAGQRVYVQSVYMTCATAGHVRLTDGTPAATHLAVADFYLAANTPTLVPQDVLDGLVKTTAGTNLFALTPGVTYFLIRYQSR